MKKALSLILAIMMLVSAIPVAYATTAAQNGTQVEHIGEKTIVDDEGKITYKADYLVTVPAMLPPGDSCHVKAEGTWPSNCSLVVTADSTVTITNNIKNSDTKTLDVTFNGITLPGDNNVSVANYDAENPGEPIAVEDVSNALFGVWRGIFYYNVELVEEKVLIPALYAEDGSVIKTWEELVADGDVTVDGDNLTNINTSEGYKLLVPGTIKEFSMAGTIGQYIGQDEETYEDIYKGIQILEFQSGLELVTCNIYGNGSLEKIIFPNTVTMFTGYDEESGYHHVFDNCWMTIVYKGVEYNTYSDWATFNSLPECYVHMENLSCSCDWEIENGFMQPEEKEERHKQCVASVITGSGVIHFT